MAGRVEGDGEYVIGRIKGTVTVWTCRVSEGEDMQHLELFSHLAVPRS